MSGQRREAGGGLRGVVGNGGCRAGGRGTGGGGRGPSLTPPVALIPQQYATPSGVRPHAFSPPIVTDASGPMWLTLVDSLQLNRTTKLMTQKRRICHPAEWMQDH